MSDSTEKQQFYELDRQEARRLMPEETINNLRRFVKGEMPVDRESVDAFLHLLSTSEPLDPLLIIESLESCTQPDECGLEESPIKIINDHDLGLLRPQKQRQILEAGIAIFENNYSELLRDKPIALQAARLAFFQEIAKPFTYATKGSNQKAFVQDDSRKIYDQLFKHRTDTAVKIASLFLDVESDIVGARIWYTVKQAANNSNSAISPIKQLEARLNAFENSFREAVGDKNGSELGIESLHDILALVYCARAAAHTRAFGFYTDESGEQKHTARTKDLKAGETLDHIFGISHYGDPPKKFIRPVISLRSVLGSYLDKCSDKVKDALFDKKYTAYAHFKGVWTKELEFAPGTTIKDIEAAIKDIAGETNTPINLHINNAFPTITADGDEIQANMTGFLVRDPSPKWPEEIVDPQHYEKVTKKLASRLGVTALRAVDSSRAIHATIGIDEGYIANASTASKYVRAAQEAIARDLTGVSFTISYVKSIAAYPKDPVEQPGVGDMWPEWLLTVNIHTQGSELTHKEIVEQLFVICAEAGQQRFYVEFPDALEPESGITIAYAA